jgi:ATP-dependent Clp protease ATP-binding subunit ClpA
VSTLVFERFTERARQVVVLAQDEARALKHNYIGTEHILLGLLREEEGLAARVLESLDVTVEEVRMQVARIIGQGDELTTGQIPFTPRAKKVLELSLREALALGNNYIGTEHVLLGLARENQGVAARILLDFGADAERIRNEVIRMLSGPGQPSAQAVSRAGPIPAKLIEDIKRLRAEKEAAIDAGEFDLAAHLRDRERTLMREAGVEAERLVDEAALSGRFADYAVVTRLSLVFGLIVAAIGFPAGLLIGWLIWG